MKKFSLFFILACAIICCTSCQKEKTYVANLFIENATLNTIFISIKIQENQQETFFRVEPYDRLLVSTVIADSKEAFESNPFPNPKHVAEEIILKIDGINYSISNVTDKGGEILDRKNYIENDKLYEYDEFYETYRVPYIFSITDEYIESLKKQ